VVYTDSKSESEQAMDEIDTAQYNEAAIVSGTDAVVEPEAVMIESFHALIAHPTVFGCSIHILAADVTEKD